MSGSAAADERDGGLYRRPSHHGLDHELDDLEQHLRSASTDREIAGLRFPPVLEARYENHLRDTNRGHAYTCTLATTIVWCLFAVFDLFRLRGSLAGGFDLVAAVWLGARWSALLVLVVALRALRSHERDYARAVIAAYVAIGIAIALTAAMAQAKGQFSADSSQIIVVMAGFLPLALLYRQALAAASIVTTVSLLVISLGMDPRDVGHQLQLGAMVAVALPTAALGGYFRELADRRQFLLGLILKLSASQDQLTELPNRRRFFEHAETVMQQANRDRRSICIALADIDFFKQYNDTRGHQAGDAVIRAVGAALKSTGRRPLDIVARYGGEEFIMLYYGVEPAGARGRLDAAMQAVAELALHHAASPSGHVSVSIGYALHSPGESDLAAVIARADAALYAAKASGRDTVAAAGASL